MRRPGPPEVPIDDPRDVAALRRRWKARLDRGDREGARVIAGVLVALGAETAHERAMARGLSGREQPLDQQAWALLAHPELDRTTSVIFEVIWPALLSLKGKTDRDCALSPRYQVSTEGPSTTLPGAFGASARALGMQPPRLFVRPDVRAGLAYMPIWPQGSFAGSTLLSGMREAELRFVTGTHLAGYHGVFYVLTMAASVPELVTLLRATLAIAQVCEADSEPLRDVVRALLRKLNAVQLEVLRLACGRLRVPAMPSVDEALWIAVDRWRRAAWLTMHRAGLLRCGEPATALRMIDALGAPYPGVSVDDARDELLRFAITEHHARLRDPDRGDVAR